MSEYVPDTETVREQYTREQPPHISTVSEKGAEFERWLAAHDREVKAEVLREMADDWMHSDPVSQRFRNWLRDTADLIESEARP